MTNLPNRLSEAVQTALGASQAEQVTIGEVIKRLEGRELGVLLLIVGIPFILPIPNPGLSTPFGFALALIGLRYLQRSEVTLPGFVSQRALSQRSLAVLRRGAVAIVTPLDRLVRPRLDHLNNARLLVGIAIISASLALAVPGPGSNVVPALSLIALALGILARDGLFVIIGAVLSGASWLYVVAVLYAAAFVFGWVRSLVAFTH